MESCCAHLIGCQTGKPVDHSEMKKSGYPTLGNSATLSELLRKLIERAKKARVDIQLVRFENPRKVPHRGSDGLPFQFLKEYAGQQDP